MKTKILGVFVLILIFLWAGVVFAQAESQAFNLLKEAKTILDGAKSKDDYQRAAQKYEEALKIFEEIKLDKGIGHCSYQLGVICFRLGQYQKSLEFYEKSLAIERKLGDVKGEGFTLNNIGQVYDSLAQYQKALEYYEKSLAFAQKIGDVRVEGVAFNNIGGVYNAWNQYEKALDFYEKSLAIKQKIGDAHGEGTTLNNIGAVYKSWGQYEKSLEFFEKSLAISRKTGNVALEGTTLDNIGSAYYPLGQYEKAFEYFENSLAISKRIGNVRAQGITLNNIGVGLLDFGQYAKALDYLEQSLALNKKIGDAKNEGVSLNKIGVVYLALRQYTKALDYLEQSLAISRKIGDSSGAGAVLGEIGAVYRAFGQYTKALDYLDQSLAIRKKIGDVSGVGETLWNVGQTYAQMGKYDEAIKAANESLVIYERIGVPVQYIKDGIANFYLDAGRMAEAEPLINETKYNLTLGRFSLMKSDYRSAQRYYENDMKLAEKIGNVDLLFWGYTGLGRAYEGMQNYPEAEEYYEKAANQVEEIRSGILPSERKNFFEKKARGFARSDPAKGLTRVRIKLNHPDASTTPSELTKARSFADHLSQANSIGATNIPSNLIEKEQFYVNQLANLKKELIKAQSIVDNQPQTASIGSTNVPSGKIEKEDSYLNQMAAIKKQWDKIYLEKATNEHKGISKSVREAKDQLNSFVDGLWKDYPAYAAVKYPRPPSIQASALRPDECAIIFDVSGEGVGVILVRDKAVSKAFYLDLKLSDLEQDVVKFREPFEKLRLKDYDPELAKSLYDMLLRPALADVPKGAPLTIIPDGILAMLPFEALATGGQSTWTKSEKGFDYPQGLTFLGDERPISYYQSITALTLARTIGNKEKPKDSLLVVADPVFNMKDRRAQQASETRLSQKEKEYNIQRMAAMEDDLGPLFPQLPETGKLAANLSLMYGSNCLSITGLKADKLDFLAKIAPRMDQYGKVVFATHGVMGNKVPGVMEPFLALTMVPPGTDGFLKMSDILSLKMNADIVALTACQTGLGKELSGEGVMSMGRAFQYAGAKSVLMTLWEVADTSSVKLTESFFQHRKSGKSKLESLKLARDEIRKQGFEHPFFWAAFILVGETN